MRISVACIAGFFAVALAMGAGESCAQQLIPFKFISEEENDLVKENDSVRYYTALNDTGNIVAINEDAMYYKLVNRRSRKKVVAEGGLVAHEDGFLQQGRWVQYHSNGRTAIAGSYLKGKPAGRWEEFYPDGRMRLSCFYAIISDKNGMVTCMSGEYREYYASGALKVSGFYTAYRNSARDTVTVEDPVAGSKMTKTIARSVYSAEKTGPWDYYLEDGELDKHEDH